MNKHPDVKTKSQKRQHSNEQKDLQRQKSKPTVNVSINNLWFQINSNPNKRGGSKE